MMADTGQTKLYDLKTHLERQSTVRLRAALHLEDDGWQAYHLEVTTDDRITTRPIRLWHYPSDVFLEQVVPGASLAPLLDSQPVEIAGFRLTTPTPLGEVANFRRVPSDSRWSSLTPRLPRTEWEVQRPSHPNARNDLLVGGEAPPFINYEAAFGAFFYDQPSTNLAANAPLWRIISVIRVAYLHKVTISSREMRVTVRGTAASEMILSLTTPASIARRRLTSRKTIVFPLPDGIQDGSLLALTNGDEWLDYHYFHQASTSQSDDLITWDDPELAFQTLISTGENAVLEYKQQLPGKTHDQQRAVMKTVTAFAATGGTVVFGIDDNLNPVGLDGDPRELRDRLTNLVNALVEPVPKFDVQEHTSDGKTFVILRVWATPGVVYCLFPDKPEFYYRRGGSTFRAGREEIAAAFRPATDPWPRY